MQCPLRCCRICKNLPEYSAVISMHFVHPIQTVSHPLSQEFILVMLLQQYIKCQTDQHATNLLTKFDQKWQQNTCENNMTTLLDYILESCYKDLLV